MKPTAQQTPPETGPIRLMHLPILCTMAGILTAVTVACYFWVDRPLLLAVRHLPHWFTWPFQWITLLGMGHVYTAVVLGLLIAGYWHQLPSPWLRRGWFALVCLIANTACVYVIKVAIGRYRPGAFLDTGQYGRDPFGRWDFGGSFPSGHSADIATVCLILCLLMPRRWPLWISVMALVGASRIIVRWHYLSDVIAGLFIGLLVVSIVRWCFRRHIGPIDGMPATEH